MSEPGRRVILDEAVAVWQRYLAPAEPEAIVTRLAKTVALMGTMSNDEARASWQIAAADLLQGIPGDCLNDALRHAEQNCRFLSEVVPAAFAWCKSIITSRQRRLNELVQLQRALEQA